MVRWVDNTGMPSPRRSIILLERCHLPCHRLVQRARDTEYVELAFEAREKGPVSAMLRRMHLALTGCGTRRDECRGRQCTSGRPVSRLHARDCLFH